MSFAFEVVDDCQRMVVVVVLSRKAAHPWSDDPVDVKSPESLSPPLPPPLVVLVVVPTVTPLAPLCPPFSWHKFLVLALLTWHN